MSVNGVTSAVNSYNTYEPKAKTSEAVSSKAEEATTGNGVVYEPSQTSTDKVKKSYTPDTNMIEKLKADVEMRTSQLRSIVESLISGQGNAIGKTDDIWSFLRTGDFTVDAETKAQAEADIAEDGYWGVEQTSDRILDFAKALTSGDPSKIEDMRKAFQEGFENATKTWGDTLPEISQKTYAAVMQKFDSWANESEIS